MTTDIEQLARLLAALPPAPQGWVTAAQQLPNVGAELAALMDRAANDAELRSKLVENLEAALDDAGIAPTRRVVAEARAQLRAF
jgi:hypothetical protein